MTELLAAIELGMPSDQYFESAGLSHSDSRNLRRSPYHYKQLREHPEVKRTSPQMELGTMVHVATLEPHAFSDRYIVGPDINHNTKEWKAFAANIDMQGLKPITQAQRDQAFAMAASVHRLPDFNALFDGDHDAETSLWWTCRSTGVVCKARPDLIRHVPGAVILGDLKTTDDASPEAFARSVADFSYHTQAHWYSDGAASALNMPVLSFLFAVVERDYPHACATYTLDDNAMKVALDINTATRELFARCHKANEWPGYPRATRDIALPPWYMKRYLEGNLND